MWAPFCDIYAPMNEEKPRAQETIQIPRLQREGEGMQNTATKKEQREKAAKALSAYKSNKAKVKLLTAELANLDKLMNANMAVRYGEDYTPKERRQQSVVERDLMSIEEKRGMIQREIVRLTSEVERIDIMLENVPERLRIILKEKYIEQKQWVAVSMQLNYSHEYIRKDLKEQALDMAYEYLFASEVAYIE